MATWLNVPYPPSPTPPNMPIPAGLNGSCIVATSSCPHSVVGTFELQSGQTLGTINLCYIPQGAALVSWEIVMSGLTAGQLQDNLSTPTVYCTDLGAGPIATIAQCSATDAGKLGTVYGKAAAAASASGPATVAWSQGVVLQIVNPVGTLTGPLNYIIEWSPVHT